MILKNYVKPWAGKFGFRLKDIFDILLPLGYETFQISNAKN